MCFPTVGTCNTLYEMREPNKWIDFFFSNSLFCLLVPTNIHSRCYLLLPADAFALNLPFISVRRSNIPLIREKCRWSNQVVQAVFLKAERTHASTNVLVLSVHFVVKTLDSVRNADDDTIIPVPHFTSELPIVCQQTVQNIR